MNRKINSVFLFSILSTFLSLNILNVFCSEVNQNDRVLLDAGELGLIQGLGPFMTMAPRRAFYTYFGMPYAKPPVETKRFQPSERLQGNLSGTDRPFMATIPGMSCSQPIPLPQSENCLTINVHTPRHPNSNETALLPVIFFIHGGAFTAGMGAIYTGYRLLTKDVVLVSINYRLGAFGFLYFGTEDVPGNAGLYDMINALEWTRDYIKYFGGDPDKVTIAGQSSGSVAVTLLMTSPLAQGLFKGAIANSGSSLAKWGIASDPIKSSLRVAELAGCISTEDDPDEAIKIITDCMQKTNAKVVVDAMYDFQTEERKEGRLGFDPVSCAIQTFDASPEFNKSMVKHPKDVFEDGEQANVPMMTGTTRHDGSYVLGVLYNRYLVPNDYVNDTEFIRNSAVSKILGALDINSDYGIIKAIEEVFLGDSTKSGDFFDAYPGFIDLLSVFFFKAPGYQTALLHSKRNPTYWYSLDYVGRHTMFYAIFGLDEAPPFRGGIAHGDDLIYIFQTTIELNAADTAISVKMVDYWANFAYHGTPTLNSTLWPNLNESHSNPTYLSIGKDSVPSNNYERSWSGIGWEVLPPTSPTRSPTSPMPTTEGTQSSSRSPDDDKDTGSHIVSFNHLNLIILLASVKLFV